jgi:hypothetical protein
LLEIEEAMEAAKAQASIYEEVSVVSEDGQSSTYDRVQQYIDEQDPNIDLPVNVTLNDTPQILFGDISPVKPSSTCNEKPKGATIMPRREVKPARVLNPDACTFVPTQWESTEGDNTLESSKSDIAQLARVFSDQMHASRLPVAEPSIFKGDPVMFSSWLTSFELLIERRQISAAERLQYLRRYLDGPA